MTQNYIRMVEIFVKADLRDEIRTLKEVDGLTYDQFLRNLIKKNGFEADPTSNPKSPKPTSNEDS